MTSFYLTDPLIWGLGGACVAGHGPSPAAVSSGYHIPGHGLCSVVASFLAEHGLQSEGSVAVVHGLSCSVAWRIFMDLGWEPVSPALAGKSCTTEPPGKPGHDVLQSMRKGRARPRGRRV